MLFFLIILGIDGVGCIVKLGVGVYDYSIGDDVLVWLGIGIYIEYFKVLVDYFGLCLSNYSFYEVVGFFLFGIIVYNIFVYIVYVK